jgi:hypothetical protein
MEDKVVHIIGEMTPNEEVPFYIMEAFSEGDLAEERYDAMEAFNPGKYVLFMNVKLNIEEME